MNTQKIIRYVFLVLFTVMNVIFAEPLTLKVAIETARGNNENISIASEKARESREAALKARTAFFPHLSGKGSYTRLNEIPSISLPPELGGMTIEMGDVNNYSISIGVQQPIFTGGMILYGYKAASAMARAAEAQFKDAESSIAADVAEAYYGVVKAEAFEEAAAEAHIQMEGHLRSLEGMYREGMLSRNDLLKAQVQLLNIETMQIQAENAVTLSRLALNITLGLPLDTVITLAPDTSLGQMADIDVNTGMLNATEQRFDIIALKEMVNAAKFGKTIAKGSIAPSIIAIANHNWNRPNREYQPEFYTSWDITLAAQWDLFTFGERLHKLREADAQYRQAEYGLDLMRKAVELDVRAQYAAIIEARKAVEVARKKLEQTNEGYRVANAEFREGMATNTDVLDANTALVSAKTEYVSAIADLQIALVKYGVAIGTVQ